MREVLRAPRDTCCSPEHSTQHRAHGLAPHESRSPTTGTGSTEQPWSFPPSPGRPPPLSLSLRRAAAPATWELPTDRLRQHVPMPGFPFSVANGYVLGFEVDGYRSKFQKKYSYFKIYTKNMNYLSVIKRFVLKKIVHLLDTIFMFIKEYKSPYILFYIRDFILFGIILYILLGIILIFNFYFILQS